VYDNASGDETIDVVHEIAKYDSRVCYHCHDNNIGSIPNFNFGMKQVDTPYFTLLSDDNTLVPNFFENAIEILNHEKEAIFFAGETIISNKKGQKISSSLHNWDEGLIYPPNGLVDIWERGIPTWESVLFRKEAIDSVGFLDPEVFGSADQYFMMKLARKHIFVVKKIPSAIYVCHAESLTFNRDLEEAVSSLKKILRHWQGDAGLSEDILIRIRREYLKVVRNWITTYIYNGAIIGNNQEVIHKSRAIIKKDLDFSFKLIRILYLAELANSNHVFKKSIAKLLSCYINIKRNFQIYKNNFRLKTK